MVSEKVSIKPPKDVKSRTKEDDKRKKKHTATRSIQTQQSSAKRTRNGHGITQNKPKATKKAPSEVEKKEMK